MIQGQGEVIVRVLGLEWCWTSFFGLELDSAWVFRVRVVFGWLWMGQGQGFDGVFGLGNGFECKERLGDGFGLDWEVDGGVLSGVGGGDWGLNGEWLTTLFLGLVKFGQPTFGIEDGDDDEG